MFYEGFGKSMKEEIKNYATIKLMNDSLDNKIAEVHEFDNKQSKTNVG